MKRQSRRYYQPNRPFHTFKGKWYTIRIWKNQLEGGQFELKADIYSHATDSATPSVPKEELNDIAEVTRLASDFMHKHEVRQHWKNLFFRH